MRNRRFLHFGNPDRKQRPPLTGQVLAKPYTSLLEEKSLVALNYGLTDLGETDHRTACLPTMSNTRYCKLERLYDEKSVQPGRHRTVAISWVETDEILLEITRIKAIFARTGTQGICAIGESSSTKDNSATEHTLSPTAAAFSQGSSRHSPKQTLRLSQLGRRVTSIDCYQINEPQQKQVEREQ